MNLATLIQKKETLFNNTKFTKALDYLFGGDLDNKATIDKFGRLVIQYKSKLEGCFVFVLNSSAEQPYFEARICRTKKPSELLLEVYQSQTIKTTATLSQFKKFLESVYSIHYYIAKQVELNFEIGNELVKLGRLEKTIK